MSKSQSINPGIVTVALSTYELLAVVKFHKAAISAVPKRLGKALAGAKAPAWAVKKAIANADQNIAAHRARALELLEMIQRATASDH